MDEATQSAAKAILTDPRSIEELLDCLGEDRVSRRLALRTITATAAVSGPSASPYLLRMLEQLTKIVPRHEDDFAHFDVSFNLLDAINATGTVARASEILRSAIAQPPVQGPSRDGYVRRMVIMLTHLKPPDAQTVTLLQALLSVPDEELRCRAASGLLELERSSLEAVQVLVDLLKLPAVPPGGAGLRNSVEGALFRVPPSAEVAIPWLVSQLSDPSPAQRRLAVEAVGLMGCSLGSVRSLEPKLSQFWFEGDSDMKRVAGVALRRWEHDGPRYEQSTRLR